MTINDINPDGYYTIRQTSEVLGICRRTVYNYIHRGRLNMSLMLHFGKYKIRIKGHSILKYDNSKQYLD